MINKLALLALLASGSALSGCASIVDGTTQQIAFDTNPPGGECKLVRNGEVIGNLKAPNSILIKKTKHDINVTCTKDGYLPSTAFLKSKVQDSTWGNIILGGGIGWAIDSARGADNKYDSHVTVTLNPDLSRYKKEGATAETSNDGKPAVTPAGAPAPSAGPASAAAPLPPLLPAGDIPAATPTPAPLTKSELKEKQLSPQKTPDRPVDAKETAEKPAPKPSA